MMKEIVDIIVFGGCIEVFIGIMAFFYAQANFEDAFGRGYRPATLRTWLILFSTAFFGLSIFFWLAMGILFLGMWLFAAGGAVK